MVNRLFGRGVLLFQLSVGCSGIWLPVTRRCGEVTRQCGEVTRQCGEVTRYCRGVDAALRGSEGTSFAQNLPNCGDSELFKVLERTPALANVFNWENLPLTRFELRNMLWKEINSVQHLIYAAAIAQPPPRQFPALPRQFPAVPQQSRHFLRARKNGLRPFAICCISQSPRTFGDGTTGDGQQQSITWTKGISYAAPPRNSALIRRLLPAIEPFRVKYRTMYDAPIASV
ncbi:hypothetical protein B0H13DRAFT_1903010 [Mycena leptocephala]|nr:hypothetical protein B0H13DRAFT_1903010 [Mycena leptocephala]